MSDLDEEEYLATRKLNGLDKEESIEEDIKQLRILLFQDRLTNFGKRKMINYYENEISKQKQINAEHQKINAELREKVKELKNEYILEKVAKEEVEELLEDSIPKRKIKEIVDECIPKQENMITREIEYSPNAKANSYLTQQILELLQEEDK